MQTRMLIDFHL
jgi:hypothetical protein